MEFDEDTDAWYKPPLKEDFVEGFEFQIWDETWGGDLVGPIMHWMSCYYISVPKGENGMVLHELQDHEIDNLIANKEVRVEVMSLVR